MEPDVQKIEMPLFNGEHIKIWLSEADNYFLHEMTEEAKVWAAWLCMTGPARVWLQIEERRHLYITWLELRTQITHCYKGAQFLALRQCLLAIKQVTTIAAYCTVFELHLLQLGDMEEEILTAVFENGLEDFIRAELVM